MESSVIKIGVMGCANIAARSVIPAIKGNASFQLVAVASRDRYKAEALAKKVGCQPITGYEQLLSANIDAVYVPLPTGLHDEWVSKCLEAGKHIFVEKSSSISYAATRRMAERAKQKGLVIMEDFMFRYHSQHAFLVKMIREGTIGRVRNFKASFGFPPLPHGNFRYDKALGGGALLDAGAYTIKAAQAILGPELSVEGGVLFESPENGVDISGSAFMIYGYETSVHLAWGFDNFYQCGYEIWGTKGKITTNRSFTAAPGYQPSLRLELPGEIREFLLPADNHFNNILEAFAEYVRSGDYIAPANEIEEQSRLVDQVMTRSARYAVRD
jgi:NDP-hexose-3-ketoreductase